MSNHYIESGHVDMHQDKIVTQGALCSGFHTTRACRIPVKPSLGLGLGVLAFTA